MILAITAAAGGAGTLALVAGYSAATGIAVAQTGAVAAAATSLFLFASSNRPRSNDKQNEQYRAVMNRLGIKKTDPIWRRIHDALHKASGHDLGYAELLKFAKEFLEKNDR